MPLISALVLHIGVRAIDLGKGTHTPPYDTSLVHSAAMDAFQVLRADPFFVLCANTS